MSSNQQSLKNVEQKTSHRFKETEASEEQFSNVRWRLFDPSDNICVLFDFIALSRLRMDQKLLEDSSSSKNSLKKSHSLPQFLFDKMMFLRGIYRTLFEALKLEKETFFLSLQESSQFCLLRWIDSFLLNCSRSYDISLMFTLRQQSNDQNKAIVKFIEAICSAGERNYDSNQTLGFLDEGRQIISDIYRFVLLLMLRIFEDPQIILSSYFYDSFRADANSDRIASQINELSEPLKQSDGCNSQNSKRKVSAILFDLICIYGQSNPHLLEKLLNHYILHCDNDLKDFLNYLSENFNKIIFSLCKKMRFIEINFPNLDNTEDPDMYGFHVPRSALKMDQRPFSHFGKNAQKHNAAAFHESVFGVCTCVFDTVISLYTFIEGLKKMNLDIGFNIDYNLLWGSDNKSSIERAFSDLNLNEEGNDEEVSLNSVNEQYPRMLIAMCNLFLQLLPLIVMAKNKKYRHRSFSDDAFLKYIIKNESLEFYKSFLFTLGRNYIDDNYILIDENEESRQNVSFSILLKCCCDYIAVSIVCMAKCLFFHDINDVGEKSKFSNFESVYMWMYYFYNKLSSHPSLLVDPSDILSEGLHILENANFKSILVICRKLSFNKWRIDDDLFDYIANAFVVKIEESDLIAESDNYLIPRPNSSEKRSLRFEKASIVGRAKRPLSIADLDKNEREKLNTLKEIVVDSKMDDKFGDGFLLLCLRHFNGSVDESYWCLVDEASLPDHMRLLNFKMNADEAICHLEGLAKDNYVVKERNKNSRAENKLLPDGDKSSSGQMVAEFNTSDKQQRRKNYRLQKLLLKKYILQYHAENSLDVDDSNLLTRLEDDANQVMPVSENYDIYDDEGDDSNEMLDSIYMTQNEVFDDESNDSESENEEVSEQGCSSPQQREGFASNKRKGRNARHFNNQRHSTHAEGANASRSSHEPNRRRGGFQNRRKSFNQRSRM